MKNQEKRSLATVLKSPKTIVALNLVIGTTAMLLPDDVSATYGCPPGNRGDCEKLVSNPSQEVCTEGAFWNDCY